MVMASLNAVMEHMTETTQWKKTHTYSGSQNSTVMQGTGSFM